VQYRERWQREGREFLEAAARAEVPVVDERITHLREHYRLPAGEHDLEPSLTVEADCFGPLFVVDWERGEIAWTKEWGPVLPTPSAFCFDGGTLYLSDRQANSIFEVDFEHDAGALRRRISHPAFNDIHSIVPTRRGLLVSCSGTDAVVEVDLQGNALYEWWAGEHGFTWSPEGFERPSGRGGEHRDRFYHTRFHTTHLNFARYRDAEERFLLVLLWQQGALVEVDTSLPAAEQTPRLVLDGLYRPHHLKPLADGSFVVANSCAGELVLLARDLSVTRRIPSAVPWVQDVVPLGDDRWLLADVNGCRLVEQDSDGNELKEVCFPSEWRLYELQALPAVAARALAAVPAL
jgi:hypothetical protein